MCEAGLENKPGKLCNLTRRNDVKNEEMNKYETMGGAACSVIRRGRGGGS